MFCLFFPFGDQKLGAAFLLPLSTFGFSDCYLKLAFRIVFGSHFATFPVAPGLRILQRFAAICRGHLLICFVFNRGVRFPKPKVACSTHAGATTVFNHFKALVVLLLPTFHLRIRSATASENASELISALPFAKP